MRACKQKNLKSQAVMLLTLILLICLLPACHGASSTAKVRVKRGAFWDFFQKVVTTKNLIVDQYSDTRNTFNKVYNTINAQFSDPAPTKPTWGSTPGSTTKSPLTKFDEEDNNDGADSNESTMSTTTEAFKISRYELGAIIGRNVRGFKRLLDVEFKDAVKATKQNLREYKAEADKQFANSLGVEKKQQLKALVAGG